MFGLKAISIGQISFMVVPTNQKGIHDVVGKEMQPVILF
jgi:hypothetical protein